MICVDPALEHPNVELMTNAHVLRLETDASGRTVNRVTALVEQDLTGSPPKKKKNAFAKTPKVC